MQIDQLNVTMLAAVVPIVMGLTQVFKLNDAVAEKPHFQPLIVLGLSIILTGLWAMAWPASDATGTQAVSVWLIHGVIAGLGSMGAYDLGIKPLIAHRIATRPDERAGLEDDFKDRIT